MTNYDIKTNVTYELQHTCNKILQTTYKHNDTIIIATLTNDARQTRRRPQKTIEQTRQLQYKILSHLTKFVPRRNIVFSEAPPIIGGDIFPYNRITYDTCRQWGVRFGPTLVGESHMWRDGFHIHNSYRHLHVKSIAAAAIDIHPHAHFNLLRPPYGVFGPWVAPAGQGMMPSISKVATAVPFHFRRNFAVTSPDVHPSYRMNIRRP